MAVRPINTEADLRQTLPDFETLMATGPGMGVGDRPDALAIISGADGSAIVCYGHAESAVAQFVGGRYP